MNLHLIANPAVATVNPNEEIVWYRNMSQTNDASGMVTPSFADGVQLTAQVQAEGDAGLYYADKAGQNDIIRKFYVRAEQATPPAGIVRLDLRGGDVIQRLLDGSWYLVDAVTDDFSARSGWVCVRGVQQFSAPFGLDSTGAEQ